MVSKIKMPARHSEMGKPSITWNGELDESKHASEEEWSLLAGDVLKQELL